LCLYNLFKWRPFFLDVAVQAFLGPIGVVLVLMLVVLLQVV
jgi:hypothetical protein